MKFASLTQAIFISAVFSLATFNVYAVGSKPPNAAHPTLQELAKAVFGKPASRSPAGTREAMTKKSAARYAKNLASRKAATGTKSTTAQTSLNPVPQQNASSSGAGAGVPAATTTTAEVSTAAVSATPVTEAAAIRFLEQASFGPIRADVRRVMQIGFSAYIDEQFGIAPTGYVIPAGGGTIRSHRDRFFSNALSGRDQLRQRVAFALGQIFVVSSLGMRKVEAIPAYQQMLLQRAFGTYAELLREVTLSPSMGTYLNMANNAAGEHPNENYAREVMQLFSVGTVELNLDGTPRLDRFGKSTPTYDQKDVEELTRALTGWTYPTIPGSQPSATNPMYYQGRMIPVESLHDHGAKVLIGNVMLASGQTAEADLTAALAAISSHPNVAPFISRRLIQHLVTSNPSGAYVQRVAAIFNNNGLGVRGDMKAVVKAILLDSEARRGDNAGELWASQTSGRLKAPAQLLSGLLRTLGATGFSGLENVSAEMGQDIFSAPSVFNFYSPDHMIPGTDVRGPEFQILSNPRIIPWANFVNIVLNGGWPGIVVDLSGWIALAGNTEALLDHLDRWLFHDSMLSATRTAIAQAINAYPPSQLATRARIALYVAATSPEYTVHH